MKKKPQRAGKNTLHLVIMSWRAFTPLFQSFLFYAIIFKAFANSKKGQKECFTVFEFTAFILDLLYIVKITTNIGQCYRSMS